MKDEMISEAIKEYGQALPPFTPPIRSRRKVGRRWAMAALATGFVAATVVLTTPSAEARAMRQMREALNDVRTLHAMTLMRSAATGKLRAVQETWMKDGVWSLEAFKGTNLQSRWLMTDTLQVVNDPIRKVSTSEPRVASFFKAKTALDYVIEQADMSGDEAVKKLVRSDGPLTNGRPTYRLTLTWRTDGGGFQDHATVVILVDREKNLPLSCETTRSMTGYRDSFIRSEYEFNVPVPKEKLEPDFKPVIDLDARQKALVAQWDRRPLAQAGKTAILDVQMNEEGAVFVLFKGKAVPNALVAADGTLYAQADDYRPGGVQGDTGTQKRCGDIRGSVFVPLTLHAPAQPRFRVSVGARGFQNPGFSQAEPASRDALSATTEVVATPCEVWPDYTVDLMLAKFFLNVAPHMASTQAKYLEKQGDVDEAVARYRLAYTRMKDFIGSVAYRDLIPAERLLRSKGRTKEADEIAAIIAREKAVDPNEPKAESTP